jgi:hypothetical protein
VIGHLLLARIALLGAAKVGETVAERLGRLAVSGA